MNLQHYISIPAGVTAGFPNYQTALVGVLNLEIEGRASHWKIKGWPVDWHSSFAHSAHVSTRLHTCQSAERR